jgi:hypothetical protein
MPAINIWIAGMARSYMYEFPSAPLVYFTHINTHAYPSWPQLNPSLHQTAPLLLN